jgi:hypothetical protein
LFVSVLSNLKGAATMKLEAATKLAEQGIEDLAKALAAGHSEILTTYLVRVLHFSGGKLA